MVLEDGVLERREETRKGEMTTIGVVSRSSSSRRPGLMVESGSDAGQRSKIISPAGLPSSVGVDGSVGQDQEQDRILVAVDASRCSAADDGLGRNRCTSKTLVRCEMCLHEANYAKLPEAARAPIGMSGVQESPSVAWSFELVL